MTYATSLTGDAAKDFALFVLTPPAPSSLLDNVIAAVTFFVESFGDENSADYDMNAVQEFMVVAAGNYGNPWTDEQIAVVWPGYTPAIGAVLDDAWANQFKYS